MHRLARLLLPALLLFLSLINENKDRLSRYLFWTGLVSSSPVITSEHNDVL